MLHAELRPHHVHLSGVTQENNNSNKYRKKQAKFSRIGLKNFSAVQLPLLCFSSKSFQKEEKDS